MQIAFDPAKNARNIHERGLPLELVADLDWETALSVEDTRKDYGERRLRVLGFVGDRLHAAIITMLSDAMHVIRFRKANVREMKRYEKQKE